MHLLPGWFEAAGGDGPQIQCLKGKEQESRGEAAASCCPIVHGEYWQACASSSRNNEWEMVFQNKTLSQPLSWRKLKDYSCFQRQNVPGWEEESLGCPWAGAWCCRTLPSLPFLCRYLEWKQEGPVVAGSSSTVLVTQWGPRHQRKSCLAISGSVPTNGARLLSKRHAHRRASSSSV